MTLRTVWWIILGLALFMLVVTAIDYIAHRKRSEPYPELSKALALSGVGGALFPVTYLVPRETLWPWVFLIASIAFQVAGAVRLRRLRRTSRAAI